MNPSCAGESRSIRDRVVVTPIQSPFSPRDFARMNLHAGKQDTCLSNPIDTLVLDMHIRDEPHLFLKELLTSSFPITVAFEETSYAKQRVICNVELGSTPTRAALRSWPRACAR